MALTHIPFPALPMPPSWFPGHMMKFTMLPALLTRTDVVLELRDSRLPLTGINRTLEGALQKWRLERGCERRVVNSSACERIIVFNKRDLGPEWGRFPDQQVLFTSWHRPRDIRDLSEVLYPYAMELNVLVIGMPNVGKSTLLNALRNMGIKGPLSTRLKLSLEPLVYTFDSPGVMLPFLGLGEEGAERRVKLTLIAGIKEGIYDAEALASYLLYRFNILNPISPAYLQLLPSGSMLTFEIEEFLESLARQEGGLISASSALQIADPSFQGATGAIPHGWGFHLEWQIRADEISGRDYKLLIQEKMEACIYLHLANMEREDLGENNVSATQRKKQQVVKEKTERKLKYAKR
ncbi:hypothetical protein DFH09DRAFT_1135627 [Mycena vulgaris]|nr:hypothetical protein DFH09DRAFT_1135627 [Mycena vulgaris]